MLGKDNIKIGFNIQPQNVTWVQLIHFLESGYYDYFCEPLDTIKSRRYIYMMREYHMVKKNSATGSLFSFRRH